MKRFIEVTGTASERGHAQGAAFSGVMPRAFEALGSLPVLPRWLPGRARSSLVRAATSALGGYYLSRHQLSDDERAYLEGLSRGIGASRAQLYGVNAFEVESAHVGFSLGCTSLALDGSRSDSGAPRLAYNHDFPAAFAPFLFVRRSAPSAAIRSLTLAYPAMVGAICGVNERGLAMSYDQAYATDGARARPATLVSLMVQRCLDQCANVDDAIALIGEHTAASGAMVTMVDRSGARSCVELSMTRQAVRRARAGEILYTFNKYRTDTLASVEIPVGAVTTGIAKGYDIHACNLTRERRFLSLDAGQVFSDASLSALMSDHDGGDGDPLTICTHGDPMSETILHALVDPTASSLTVRFGHPCKTAPTRYDLATDASRPEALSASMA